MEAAQARLSLHLSKCYIVGNHMSRLIILISHINCSIIFAALSASQYKVQVGLLLPQLVQRWFKILLKVLQGCTSCTSGSNKSISGHILNTRLKFYVVTHQ